MKYKSNIKSVAQLQPNYLGFIFHKKSPRYFNSRIPKLPKHIKKVGVFVNQSFESIKKIAETHQLDVLQLHGNETVAFCRQLKTLNLKIIKVFMVSENFDFGAITKFEQVCDYFLFDTKGKLPGGNGYAFNWELLKNYNSKKPYFLSGGIGLNEIDNLKHFLNSEESKYCHALDVNSKFEIKPGLKNIADLEAFTK